MLINIHDIIPYQLIHKNDLINIIKIYTIELKQHTLKHNTNSNKNSANIILEIIKKKFVFLSDFEIKFLYIENEKLSLSFLFHIVIFTNNNHCVFKRSYVII